MQCQHQKAKAVSSVGTSHVVLAHTWTTVLKFSFSQECRLLSLPRSPGTVPQNMGSQNEVLGWMWVKPWCGVFGRGQLLKYLVTNHKALCFCRQIFAAICLPCNHILFLIQHKNNCPRFLLSNLSTRYIASGLEGRIGGKTVKGRIEAGLSFLL